MASAPRSAASGDQRTVRAALADARRRLTAAAVSSPALDAELLLAHVLDWTHERVLTHPERPITPAQLRRFRHLMRRREARVPIAYLTGVKEFYGYSLRVTPRVLIPRPETELLVELAVDFLQRHRRARDVIDLGTGSGAVAIAIARAVRQVRVVATDVDAAALRVAAQNIRAHRLTSRISTKRADLLTGASPADVIVANLPYLSAAERERWQAELAAEPVLALDGGRDGMDLLRRALAQAPPVLKPGGCLLMEVDPGQAAPLRREAAGRWRAGRITIHKDLAGRARALRVELP